MGQERNRPSGATLCWLCRNAVPSPETGAGCSWSRKPHTPVPGWEAERRDLYGYASKGSWKAGVTESYRVLSCPEFQEG